MTLHNSELCTVFQLDDVTVDAKVIALNHITIFRGRGHCNDRDAPSAWARPDASEHFQTVHSGQLQIEQDHARVVLDTAMHIVASSKDEIQGFDSVACNFDMVC